MKHQLTIMTGASRGLGLALARQLLVPGATLVCISRHTSDALVQAATKQGAALEQWTLDLSHCVQVANALKAWLQSKNEGQWLSATLINNAGVIPAVAPLRLGDPNDLSNALRVGLEAPMLLSAAFVGATGAWTIPRKVLNISSGLGRRAMASSAAYCAAKAGMDHFTRSLAMDEARVVNGARVCSLAPGVIDTDMQVQLRGADVSQFPDRAMFADLHTKGQLSSADDAASHILAYLARPDFGSEPVADVRDQKNSTSA